MIFKPRNGDLFLLRHFDSASSTCSGRKLPVLGVNSLQLILWKANVYNYIHASVILPRVYAASSSAKKKK